jgi:hypothetical protein
MSERNHETLLDEVEHAYGVHLSPEIRADLFLLCNGLLGLTCSILIYLLDQLAQSNISRPTWQFYREHFDLTVLLPVAKQTATYTALLSSAKHLDAGTRRVLYRAASQEELDRTRMSHHDDDAVDEIAAMGLVVPRDDLPSIFCVTSSLLRSLLHDLFEPEPFLVLPLPFEGIAHDWVPVLLGCLTRLDPAIIFDPAVHNIRKPGPSEFPFQSEMRRLLYPLKQHGYAVIPEARVSRGRLYKLDILIHNGGKLKVELKVNVLTDAELQAAKLQVDRYQGSDEAPVFVMNFVSEENHQSFRVSRACQFPSWAYWIHIFFDKQLNLYAAIGDGREWSACHASRQSDPCVLVAKGRQLLGDG